MTDCCVYFISNGRAVKIGFTSDLRGRMLALSTSSDRPLRLLGVVPGGPDLEAKFHRALADHRLHGEWFKTDAALKLLDSVVDENVVATRASRKIASLCHEAMTWRLRLRAVEAELAATKAELARVTEHAAA